MGDETPAASDVLAHYNVVEVPTFLFFKGGREVARHVGSSRGDLIGRILQASKHVLCFISTQYSQEVEQEVAVQGLGRGPQQQTQQRTHMGM
jgi:hypothetical protein